MKQGIFFLVTILLFGQISSAQSKPWHGIEREVHYRPDGGDFALVNGSRRFNRALYGGNTAFRVEAGDLPEFALYLPGMGGNMKFGLIKNGASTWLIHADSIETRYRPGSMIYRIQDPLLDGGRISITVLSLYETEGMIIKLDGENMRGDVNLIAAYGGATGLKFSRDGDIGADPESSFYLKPEYCSDNIYSINKNQFSVFFGSKKPLSEEERYEIQHFPKQGTDSVNQKNGLKSIGGIFPVSARLRISDANEQQTPETFLQSKTSKAPTLCASMQLKNGSYYFLLRNQNTSKLQHKDLAALFQKTEKSREQLAQRIQVNTPDPYINTLGGALSVAADAIWEDPSYLHGAVAWRMRLNGWRGAYVADVLGWHDRAKKHFSAYALSQLTEPANGPVIMDTALHLARGLEKLGTSMFSRGYISRNPGGGFRPHHYDMNLVFIDQLLNHFYWTGDTAYLRTMWPLLVRHLEWEKRNFDSDGDGLYDAYAAIWASDALQYSGGGVTHSSAYNYRSNLLAAQLAKLIGEDGTAFEKEARKISAAIQGRLWLHDEGVFAEYKDLLGRQLLHPAPGLWTIYHAIDARVPDAFQRYQVLRYVDENIPHIPIRAKGLADTNLYTISTTNWQPYTWSLNNVALSELLHTSLAYWQGGRTDAAFRLWKSSLVESMYLGASPGNFEQLSFYDAMRGELYRDFADVIGMAGRSLVEGLFGIEPDLLHESLYIRPGFPAEWDHASIASPDIEYSFKRTGNKDVYHFTTHFKRKLHLQLTLSAPFDGVSAVLVNGMPAGWNVDSNAVGHPLLQIVTNAAEKFTVEIQWKGRRFGHPQLPSRIAKNENIVVSFDDGSIGSVCDPQQSVQIKKKDRSSIEVVGLHDAGSKTFFIRRKQGDFLYWLPFSFEAVPALQLHLQKIEGSNATVELANNTASLVNGSLSVGSFTKAFSIAKDVQSLIVLPVSVLTAGTNRVQMHLADQDFSQELISWDLKNPASTKYDKVDLSAYFNDRVSNIFENQYLGPRPQTTTLQLPTQGVGNWAYPLVKPAVNDSGLRKRAGVKNEFTLQQNIAFATPSTGKNIVFTSQWSNYPNEISVPLNGRSSHAYFLLAGSTNAMQSQMINGAIIVEYKDGTADTLELKNPQNWWPIEQDYLEDGYAFSTGAPTPPRVYLKTGEDSRTFTQFVNIRGFSSRAIDGGAATVVDLPLDPGKILNAVRLQTLANDVVIGLMSMTLVRNHEQ